MTPWWAEPRNLGFVTIAYGTTLVLPAVAAFLLGRRYGRRDSSVTGMLLYAVLWSMVLSWSIGGGAAGHGAFFTRGLIVPLHPVISVLIIVGAYLGGVFVGFSRRSVPPSAS